MWDIMKIDIKGHNLELARKLIGGTVRSDGGPAVLEGEFFTVSTDEWFASIILTGFNQVWPERFITHMGDKLGTHVTTVFRWEGERGEDSFVDITDDMMEQVYERMKKYD